MCRPMRPSIMARMIGKPGRTMDIREANVGFHHAERLKSNFLLVAQALDSLSGLRGQELDGARGVLKALFAGLLTEIRIAEAQTASGELAHAELMVVQAEESLELGNHDEAGERLGEGLAQVTTLSQQYIEPLLAADLL